MYNTKEKMVIAITSEMYDDTIKPLVLIEELILIIRSLKEVCENENTIIGGRDGLLDFYDVNRFIHSIHNDRIW